MEPINACAVDKSRELARLDPEVISNRREAKNVFEVPAHLVKEVFI
ncbi:MAG: hypothetical protein ACTSWQ_01755 [Candidatus Thorarchaeota archaeon]